MFRVNGWFKVESVILFLFLSCFSMFKSPTPTNLTHSWRPIVYSSAPSVTFRVDKGLVFIFLQANWIAYYRHQFAWCEFRVQKQKFFLSKTSFYMILTYHFGFPYASDELHVVEPTYYTNSDYNLNRSCIRCCYCCTNMWYLYYEVLVMTDSGCVSFHLCGSSCKSSSCDAFVWYGICLMTSFR